MSIFFFPEKKILPKKRSLNTQFHFFQVKLGFQQKEEKGFLYVTNFLCKHGCIISSFIGISVQYKANILYFRYTRNLVDNGNGKFNLMILCWGEGHGRFVSKDHGFSKQIQSHCISHCYTKREK